MGGGNGKPGGYSDISHIRTTVYLCPYNPCSQHRSFCSQSGGKVQCHPTVYQMLELRPGGAVKLSKRIDFTGDKEAGVTTSLCDNPREPPVQKTNP
jgi:hypothetical protein